MFSIPRTNVIASDCGFSVEVLGRCGLEYSEGERAVRIDSEVGTKGMIVFARWMESWDRPVPGEAIDAETKARIIENIRAAFRFRGVEIETID